MQTIPFELRGEFITLDRLLKATGLASSGGVAKMMVSDGRVQVDGRDELRKTAKLRAGQVVSLTGVRITLRAAAQGGAQPAVVDGAAPEAEAGGHCG
jgi:ribosome-associated protein